MCRSEGCCLVAGGHRGVLTIAAGQSTGHIDAAAATAAATTSAPLPL